MEHEMSTTTNNSTHAATGPEAKRAVGERS